MVAVGEVLLYVSLGCLSIVSTAFFCSSAARALPVLQRVEFVAAAMVELCFFLIVLPIYGGLCVVASPLWLMKAQTQESPRAGLFKRKAPEAPAPGGERTVALLLNVIGVLPVAARKTCLDARRGTTPSG